MGFILGIPIGIKLFINDNLVTNYLTDSRLILDFEFYKYIIDNQITPNTTRYLIYFSLIGLGITPLLKSKSVRNISLGFLLTALIFFIVASKSILPHSYYTLPIMFSIIIFSSITLYTILSVFKSKIFTIIFFLILSVFLLTEPIIRAKTLISRETKEYEEIVEYLNENTSSGDFFIDEAYILTVLFDTDLYRTLDINVLANKSELKESIKEIGFSRTMNKYKIKYLITKESRPNYESYVPLFTEKSFETSQFDRGQLLLNLIHPDNYYYFPDQRERSELVKELDIMNKFVLEKQIGVYRFYTFQN